MPEEIKTLGIALILGAVCGLLYDIIQMWITVCRLKRWQWLGDLFFWLLAFLIVATGFLLTTQGEIRLYYLLLLLVGALFYNRLFFTRLRRCWGRWRKL